MPTMKPTQAEAAEYFRLIAESSDDAIVGVTLDGRITTWSRAAERTFGYSGEEAVGKSLSIILPGAGEQEEADSLDRVRRGETIERLRTVLQRKDRTTIEVQMTLSPVHNAVGDVTGGLAIIRDLSEAARAEGELEQSEESPVGREAERAMRRSERLAAIGTFAAGVAHEINNPLGGILMAAQFALSTQENPESPAMVRKALEDIEVDARRCGDIVRSILRFARQDTLETAPCTLDELVQSAIRLTRKDAEGKADVLFLEAQGSRPEVLASRTEMEQAISNVLRSAINSKPEGARVVIQTDYTNDRALLMVRDDGEGVPEEHLEYLFDPFYTTRRELGGSGLGLSMAHSIVTAHGGTIEVSSSRTSGTTVTIELPLKMPDPEDPR